MNSRYPFFLRIAQGVTERVLRARLSALGGRVEWSTELQSLCLTNNDANPVETVLTVPGGLQQRVTCDWLIGCDGAHSTVRHQLGLDFNGEQYAGMRLPLMDVPLRGFPLADDAAHWLISSDRLLLVVKLPGANHRLILSELDDRPAHPAAWDGFHAAFDEHFGCAVQMGEPAWASVFRISRRTLTAKAGSSSLATPPTSTPRPAVRA